MVTLTLSSAAGFEGSPVTLTLSIASTGGDQSTAVQFTLGFSPSDLTLSAVALGAAGTGASKTLSRAGSLVVIWGVNTNVIADGTLATITFLVADPPSRGSIPVTLSRIVAADADANPLTTTSSPGTITVDIVTLSCPANGTAQLGEDYSGTLLASGGTGPYTFSIVS